LPRSATGGATVMTRASWRSPEPYQAAVAGDRASPFLASRRIQPAGDVPAKVPEASVENVNFSVGPPLAIVAATRTLASGTAAPSASTTRPARVTGSRTWSWSMRLPAGRQRCDLGGALGVAAGRLDLERPGDGRQLEAAGVVGGGRHRQGALEEPAIGGVDLDRDHRAGDRRAAHVDHGARDRRGRLDLEVARRVFGARGERLRISDGCVGPSVDFPPHPRAHLDRVASGIIGGYGVLAGLVHERDLRPSNRRAGPRQPDGAGDRHRRSGRAEPEPHRTRGRRSRCCCTRRRRPGIGRGRRGGRSLAPPRAP
jgi:hypothetical protein